MSDTAYEYFKKDILDTISPNVYGMAWKRGWTYNGGQGLAGWHAEDGFLHYGHFLIDIKLTLHDPVQKRLVEVLQKVSNKVWVYSEDRSIPEVLGLNRLVAGIWEKNSVADELLAARSWLRVLDPRIFEGFPGIKIGVQKNGEFVIGGTLHSVLGCGFFSVACNFVFADYISYYIEREKEMATHIRGVTADYRRARKDLADGGSLRSFYLKYVGIFQ
eukprot:jgi/Chrzof1/10424/UNPLg00350.t1